MNFKRLFCLWSIFIGVSSAHLHGECAESGCSDTAKKLEFHGVSELGVKSDGWLKVKVQVDDKPVEKQGALGQQIVMTGQATKDLKENTVYGGRIDVEWQRMQAFQCGTLTTAYFKLENACSCLVEVRYKHYNETEYSEWERKTSISFAASHGGEENNSGTDHLDFEIRLRPQPNEGGNNSGDDGGDNDNDGGGGGNGDNQVQNDSSPGGLPESAYDVAPDGGGQPASVAPASVSSVLSMGTTPLSNGFDTGSLVLEGPISPTLADASKLRLADPYVNALQVIKVGTVLRQVTNSTRLADIQALSGGGFEVRFYYSGSFGTTLSGGVYPLNSGAAAFKTVQYLPISNGIRIATTGADGTTRYTDYISSTPGLYSVSKNGIEATEYSSFHEYVDGKWQQTVVETTTRDGQPYSKIEKTYRYFKLLGGDSYYKRLIEQLVYTSAVNFEASYWYYNSQSARLVKSISPDGSWEVTTYYSGDPAATDRGNPLTPEVEGLSIEGGNYTHMWEGKICKIYRTFNGAPLVYSVEAQSDMAITEVKYSIPGAEGAGDGVKERGRTTKVGDATISQTGVVDGTSDMSSMRSALLAAGLDVAWTPGYGQIESHNTRQFASATEILTSTTAVYSTGEGTLGSETGQGSPSWPWTGSTFFSVQPDGNSQVIGYQMGSYNPSTGGFSVSAPSLARATMGSDVMAITVTTRDGVATKNVTIKNFRDQVLRNELWVTNGAGSWAMATATTYECPAYWPDGSVKERIVKKDGRIISHVTQISSLETLEIDEEGIRTTTTTDLSGRPISVRREGVSAASGYSSQQDLITSYAYSGCAATVTTSGGETALSEITLQDWMGRTISHTDATGAVTTTSYNELETLVTRPGGVTELTTLKIGGQLESVKGSGIIDQVYEYGVNWTKIRTGDVENSPRYTVTYTDWAGRTLGRSTSSPSGDITTSYGYELSSNRIKSISGPYGSVLYDDAHHSTGYDVTGDGVLTPASTDRLMETSKSYAFEDGYWWQVSTQKQYDVDGSSSSAITTVQKNCLHGAPGTGVVARSITIGPAGETTTLVTTVDPVSKIKTQTVTRGTATSIQVSYNGLLVSRTGFEGGAPSRWSHDDLGRVIAESNPRGAVTRTAYNSVGQLESTTDSYGKITSYQYYGSSNASAGRVSLITLPGGTTKSYLYDALGNVTEEAGTAAYKVNYQYDEYGQKKKMSTWRASGGSDDTTWTYEPTTGLLGSKTYPDSHSVSYTYNAMGKVLTRTWARGVTTTYAYNTLGDLTGINYLDGTPNVTFSNFDRVGRPATVTQTGLGSETFSYHPATGAIKSRYYTSSHGLLAGLGIRYPAPDGGGRLAGYSETSGSDTTVERTIGYSYDGMNRLGTINDGAESHAYSYQEGTSQVTSLESTTSGTAWFKETRSLDNSGRLIGIRSDRMTSSSSVLARISNYAYDYDALGRRTQATLQDGSRWEYGYNDHSEVTAASRKDASGNTIAPLGATYAYDGIGNRTASTSAVLGDHSYTANSNNQYGTITTAAGRTAIGRAPAAWNVEVYPSAATPTLASRAGEVYYRALAAANSAAPVWQSVVTRRDTGTPTTAGNLWYAKQSVTPTHDVDGNLTSDGRWVYTWDAENRLSQMETTSAATTAGHPYTKLVFKYDWQGRRIERAVWKGGTAGSPTFSSRRRWIYDGWNPIVEFDSNAVGSTNTRLRTFTWGIDLSNTLQGAGGVGGLIVQTDVSGTVKRRASYDGNGNIIAWTRSDQSAPDYRREYDAFGNTLVSEGVSPSDYGFSTKQQDVETGLYYYGYRYYDALNGRWLNKDPIGERDGENLYAFLRNIATSDIDFLGMYSFGAGYGALPISSNSDYRSNGDINPLTQAPMLFAGLLSSDYLFEIFVKFYYYGNGSYKMTYNDVVHGTMSNEDGSGDTPIWNALDYKEVKQLVDDRDHLGEKKFGPITQNYFNQRTNNSLGKFNIEIKGTVDCHQGGYDIKGSFRIVDERFDFEIRNDRNMNGEIKTWLARNIFLPDHPNENNGKWFDVISEEYGFTQIDGRHPKY